MLKPNIYEQQAHFYELIHTKARIFFVALFFCAPKLSDLRNDKRFLRRRARSCTNETSEASRGECLDRFRVKI